MGAVLFQLDLDLPALGVELGGVGLLLFDVGGGLEQLGGLAGGVRGVAFEQLERNLAQGCGGIHLGSTS